MEHEKLNELIKLAIGTRSLRQVEEESGISHGLLGKVLNNTQKASVVQNYYLSSDADGMCKKVKVTVK